MKIIIHLKNRVIKKYFHMKLKIILDQNRNLQ